MLRFRLEANGGAEVSEEGAGGREAPVAKGLMPVK